MDNHPKDMERGKALKHRQVQFAVQLNAICARDVDDIVNHYAPKINSVHNGIVSLGYASNYEETSKQTVNTEDTCSLDSAYSMSSSETNDCSNVESKDGLHFSQSIAVGCIIGTHSFSDVDFHVKQQLRQYPWHINHIHRIVDPMSFDVIAKTDYHTINKDFPLISYETTSRRNDIVRLTIFVKDMKSMLGFYKNLLQRKPYHSQRGNLYYFNLDSKETGVDVELVLKFSPHLKVLETKYTCLLITIEQEDDWRMPDHVTITQDPDSNHVHVQSICSISKDKLKNNLNRQLYIKEGCNCNLTDFKLSENYIKHTSSDVETGSDSAIESENNSDDNLKLINFRQQYLRVSNV